MRRALLNEEKAPVQQNAASRKNRVLKGAYVVLAGIGIVCFLIPALSQTPLSEISLNAALKTGNLAVATSAFTALPAEDVKTKEYYLLLFPRLLEAGDYERAARVMSHTNAQGAGGFFFPPSDNSNPQPLSVGVLGKHMGATIRLQDAMKRIKNSPDLTAIRASLLPSVFLAASSKDLPALEKLAPTLQGQERLGAVGTILHAHTKAKNWDAAWRWTAEMPAEQRGAGEDYVLTQIMLADFQEGIRRLQAWRNTPKYLSRISGVFAGMAYSHPREAMRLIPLLSSSRLQDQAIGGLLKNQMWGARSLTNREITELLDKQSDPAIKAWTLVQRLEPMVNRGGNATGDEFVLQEVVPRLTALARQNPTLTPLHDEFLQDRSAHCPEKFRERYLAQIVDPAKKNPTAHPELKLLDRVTRADFSLDKPADFDSLTGLRD